jgi:hypothetical protein
MGPSQPAPNDAIGSAGFTPGHNRANSADDTQVIRPGGIDPAKRYRRRSFNGLEGDNNVTSTMASLQVSSGAGPSTTPSANTTTSSNSNRAGSRPASSHSHERQGSAGSASSNNSSRSQVSTLISPDCYKLTQTSVSPCSHHSA